MFAKLSPSTANSTLVESSSNGLTARQQCGSLGGWARPNTGQSESALRRFEKGLERTLQSVFRRDMAVAIGAVFCRISSGVQKL